MLVEANNIIRDEPLPKGPPFAGWKQSVLDSDDGNLTPPFPKKSRGSADKGLSQEAKTLVQPKERIAKGKQVIVWSAPGSKWKRLSSRRIKFNSGKLYVKAEVSSQRAQDRFEVITPVGVASGRKAEVFLEIKPVVKKTRGKQSQLLIAVRAGEVEFANSQGRATGSAGVRFHVEKGSAPAKVRPKK
jgi:hypothetical protein